MIHTMHHLKTVGDEYWREIVDMQARKGAYEMERATDRGIVEIRPRAGSDIHLRLEIPESYAGAAADYADKAYVVEGNLMALFGVTEEEVTFPAGEASLEFWATAPLPVQGKLLTITENRRGNADGGRIVFTYQFTRYSTQTSQNMEQYKAYDTTTTHSYDFAKLEAAGQIEADVAGALNYIQIRRTGDISQPLTIRTPILSIAHDGENQPCSVTEAGNIREIEWTGEDTAFAVPAASDLSHWVILKTYRMTNGGSYPRCKALVMGNLDERMHETWEKMAALHSDLDERKVEKETGKGLSANDFTDKLKAKLDAVEEEANKYVLPVASVTELGGVKVGSVRGEDEEVIEQSGERAEAESFVDSTGLLKVTVPPATKSEAGVVRLGEGLELEHLYVGENDGGAFDGWARVKQMVGASGSTDGSFGAPPAPEKGEQDKFLRGDGTWASYNDTMLAMFPTGIAPQGMSDAMPQPSATVNITDAAVGVPFQRVDVYSAEDGGDVTLTFKGLYPRTNDVTFTRKAGTYSGYFLQLAQVMEISCEGGTAGVYYYKSPRIVIEDLVSRVKALENA